MRVVIQRVKNASVSVNNQVVGDCGFGYLLLVGFTQGDNKRVAELMAKKILTLRIFNDEEGKMNKSLLDIGGEILSISQFTLYASCTEGRRPSFTNALEPKEASNLYDYFNECLKTSGLEVGKGVFGADMEVNLTNMGPVTIILDSKELKF